MPIQKVGPSITTFKGTGEEVLASGTNAERPASPTLGSVRFNSTLNTPEWWNGTYWKLLTPGPLAETPATSNLLIALDVGDYMTYLYSGGNTLQDIQGNYSGTMTSGAVVRRTGEPRSVYFDGTNDWVNFGTTTGTPAIHNLRDASFSQSFVFKLHTSVGGTSKVLFHTGDTHHHYFWVSNTDCSFAVGYSDPVDALGVNNTFTTNRWYHATIVWTKQSVQKIYINGVEIGSRTPTASSYQTGTDGNVNLGRGHNDPFSRYFPGNIAVFKTWNTALTAAQVMQDYKSVLHRFDF